MKLISRFSSSHRRPHDILIPPQFFNISCLHVEDGKVPPVLELKNFEKSLYLVLPDFKRIE